MEYPLGREVEIFDDLEDLSHASARIVIDELSKAIGPRDFATLALPGGETPKRLYEILSTKYKDEAVWKSTQFFLGDERCVPLTDPKSNFRMIQDSLLNPLGIPAVQIHHPNTALDTPKEIANAYEQDLRDFFGKNEPGFDVILLGMGADGHTASIFPETPIESGDDRAVIATLSPISPRDRVTVTMNVINASRVALIQVSGNEKAVALSRVLALRVSAAAPLPAARVNARNRTCFMVDRAANPA